MLRVLGYLLAPTTARLLWERARGEGARMLSSSGGSDGWNAKLRAYERRQARKQTRLETSCNQSCEQDTRNSCAEPSNTSLTCQTLETVPSTELRA
eukprot:3788083-Pleurochrysis_carterae.AAC.1